MDRVTLRLPAHVIRAYDEADGTRSAVMRRILTRKVADGEVEGVPDDLRTLAQRDDVVDANQLGRETGKFRSKCYGYFERKWSNGAVTPDDVDLLAESWRDEAALYGPDRVAFVDAIVEWWHANYRTDGEAPGFPDARHFVGEADPESVDVSDRLVSIAENARESGADRETVIDRLSASAPEPAVRAAADRAFGGEGGDA